MLTKSTVTSMVANIPVSFRPSRNSRLGSDALARCKRSAKSYHDTVGTSCSRFTMHKTRVAEADSHAIA